MRKTLIYLILLVVLGLGVYYFIFNNKENIYAANEAAFTLKDSTAIGRIYIGGPGKNSILLERTDSGWIVNKKYKALTGTLSVLLKTMAKQEALYPVPKAMHNMVVKDLAGTGIKVEIDDRENKKMRVFYVGGDHGDVGGTYMLMEGAKQPYVVQVQGFQGSLKPSYSYNLEDWRDRTVFNLKPEEIKSVSVQYADQPLNSFVINQDKGKLSVIVNPEISKYGKLNEHRAKSYLKFFEKVSCEGYINGAPDVDSILKTVPKHCTMETESVKGQKQRVEIYWMEKNRRSKNLTSINPNVPDNAFDADHFYAVMNDSKDTVMIQSYVFNKLFRAGVEFYQPDVTQEDVNKEAQAHPKEERRPNPLSPLLPRGAHK